MDKQEMKDLIGSAIEEVFEEKGLNQMAKRFVPSGDPADGNGHGSADEPRFKNFGEQLMAVYRAEAPGATPDPRLLVKAPSGLSESVPSEGGFLVQQDFVDELMRRTYAFGEVTNRCRKIAIGPNANGLKMNAVAESNRATGSRWGGVRAYWTEEGGAKTASQMKFRQMEMSLQKLTGLCYLTDELLRDTVALEDVMMQAFSEEFAFMVEDAIVNGTGAGEPLGVLNSPCLVSVAKETGQTADTVVTENIVKMWSRLWSRSKLNSVWYVNQNVEPQLGTLVLEGGASSYPVYMPPGGLSEAPYGRLMGRPVIPIEYCAAVGTVGDLILADMSQYLLIDKGAMEGASSIHVRFLYDETAFRFTYRVNGQPAWDLPLTPYKGTDDTQSPFVALASRD